MTRPYIATLHRQHQVVWVRHYARFGTAVRRAAEIAVTESQPGDVIEFAYEASGYQIGVMKVRTGGRLSLEWTT